MNLINAILLLVHFLIMSRPNISCVRFYAYVYVFYDFTFCLSVLFSLFCKHVRLSCVFLNKLTYLLTTYLLTRNQNSSIDMLLEMLLRLKATKR